MQTNNNDPVSIPPSRHQIDTHAINRHAISAVQTLLDAGFQAYLVGGCIRDLLLGLKPKDFDISTNARPEDILKLFKRARIIGRRFRIVHVYFGREMLEITTFRGHHPEDGEHPHASQSESGQLLRDNIYGTASEDALRRDFTANALYYDINDGCVLDYAKGYEDIQRRTLRIIGDPEKRYREDPVRMLRALRFAGKLDFELEQQTAAPIRELADLLSNIPPARLFDESLKVFLSGYGSKTLPLLREYGIFEQLYPFTKLDNSLYSRMVEQALANTDQRLAIGKGVTPAFFYAVVLWPPLQEALTHHQQSGMPEAPALHRAAQEVISAQLTRTSIPRRFSLPMKEIWDFQLRLPRRHGKRADKLLHHPRFRAAYDFLLLREQCGEQCDGLGQWWTEYQAADRSGKHEMIKALSSNDKPNRRRRRKPRTRRSNT
ncbi:MAG: polynucleotide adenylyltransferase PcnB [Pseudomonadales bacterium]